MQSQNYGQITVAHACNLSYSGRQRSGGSQLEASTTKSSPRPYLKNTQHTKEMVEWFKMYALISNPIITEYIYEV
jgi:hypothetical protein